MNDVVKVVGVYFMAACWYVPGGSEKNVRIVGPYRDSNQTRSKRVCKSQNVPLELTSPMGLVSDLLAVQTAEGMATSGP
jgi:hypothetical protein